MNLTHALSLRSPGELTMKLKRRLAIRLMRLFWSGKASEVEFLSIGSNHCQPRSFVSLVIPNPLKARGICSGKNLIPDVLCGGRRTEIAAPIVQSITIDVVAVLSIPKNKAKYFPVHQHCSSLAGTTVSTSGVICFEPLVVGCGPVVFGKSFIIFGIHYCELAASEKNYAVGLRGWERHARVNLSKRFRVGLCRMFQASDAPIISLAGVDYAPTP